MMLPFFYDSSIYTKTRGALSTREASTSSAAADIIREFFLTLTFYIKL